MRGHYYPPMIVSSHLRGRENYFFGKGIKMCILSNKESTDNFWNMPERKNKDFIWGWKIVGIKEGWQFAGKLSKKEMFLYSLYLGKYYNIVDNWLVSDRINQIVGKDKTDVPFFTDFLINRGIHVLSDRRIDEREMRKPTNNNFYVIKVKCFKEDFVASSFEPGLYKNEILSHEEAVSIFMKVYIPQEEIDNINVACGFKKFLSSRESTAIYCL